MKTKKFTFGIILFLFAFFASLTVAQAQVTVFDDFDIPDGPLTDLNGTSGSGWSDAWTYDTKTIGVTANNGAFEASDGGFGITRNLSAAIPLGTSTFYMSFIVKKSATGEFVILGRRADGISRYAVGIKANGTIDAYVAADAVKGSSEPGLIENDKAYLVVAKWWYSGKGYMNIISFAGADAIPTDEPATGAWDLEAVGGATGVPVEKFRIAFSAADVTLYDFKISSTWADATQSTVVLAPSDVVQKATSATEATINWTDNSFNEEGSRIFLDGTELGTVAADVELYGLTGLTNLNQYKVGVSAYDGIVASDTTELSFTFELDETPPTVVETNPADNAVDVDETSDIVITFSEEMDKTSVEGAISTSPALSNPVYAWDGETKLTISADDLTSQTLYTLTVGTGAKDLSGNGLAAAYVSSFTVILKDVIPPTIVESSPADGATGVLISSTFSLTFSEDVDRQSVESAISVSPALTNIKFTWLSSNSIKVSGDGFLAKSTAYTITVGTGVLDLKNNAMAAEKIITITTGASDLLQIDNFNIPDGQYTDNNGTSGDGWNGPWSYATGGFGLGTKVYATDGHLSSSSPAGQFIRKINQPFAIASSSWYVSFLAYRLPGGSFDVLTGDFNGGYPTYRAGVNVDAEGTVGLRINTATKKSPTTGQFQEGTTYLVVSKYTGGGLSQVKIFKAGDNIVEPADGSWDFEEATGATGLTSNCFGILFRTPGVNMDDLKIGNAWADVANTTITDISTFPVIEPSGLSLIANSPNSVDVKWTDNCLVEDGFKIYLNSTEVGTTAADENFFNIKGLTEDVTYTISVSAFKGNVEVMSADTAYTLIFDAENYVDTRIEIGKTSAAPTIDGTVDDVWAGVFKNPVKRVNSTTEKAPETAADYQCTWSAMWDENKLYFLIEVSDSSLFLYKDGDNIGQFDGFDLPMALSPDGVWTMNRLNLTAGTNADTIIIINEGMAAVKNAEKAYTFTDAGYNIELAIDIRQFDENIGLIVPENYQFRIDVRYNDNDDNVSRDGQYTWTDKNEEGWTWNNMNSLGYVTLVAVIDNTAPTVTLTSPADAATNVAVDSDIAITFSEAMDKTSVEGAITVAPALTNAQFTWDGDTKVTISADNLSADTDYSVTISPAATDANENTLVAEFSFSFKTAFAIGITTLEASKISVYLSENGSLLNIMNYEGRADIYSITGTKVQSVLNSSQAININQLEKGIYIVKTEKASLKFVK